MCTLDSCRSFLMYIQVASALIPGTSGFPPLQQDGDKNFWFNEIACSTAFCFRTKFLIRQIIPEVYPLDGPTLLGKMTVAVVLVILLEKYESSEAQEVRSTIGMWRNIFPWCVILIYDVESKYNLSWLAEVWRAGRWVTRDIRELRDASLIPDWWHVRLNTNKHTDTRSPPGLVFLQDEILWRDVFLFEPNTVMHS